MILRTDKCFTYSSFNDMLDEVGELQIVKNKKGMEYYNAASMYDTETSSFFNEEGRKCGITYAFMLGLAGYVCLLRTWQEFIHCYNILVERYKTEYDKRHLVIYIHNEGYEFQFMRKRFNFVNVFAVDERKPIYAITEDGIEFRDSYILSALSLEKVGEGLRYHHIKKAVGNLNYRLIRHSQTPLEPEEVVYCVNDVFVGMAYIDEQIMEYGDITKIPLTNTGRVRDYTRKRCMKNKGYHKLMRYLTIGSVDEMLQLKRAFAGGFTHANSCNMGITFEEVFSMDLCSAYPAVMLYCGYPMSRAVRRSIKSYKQLWYFLHNFCCVFDVEFTNLRSVDNAPDHYISSSKCVFLEGSKYNDNGRVVEAEKVRITLTDVDFKIINKWYKWDDLKVTNFNTYKRGYLPKEIVECVLEFYKNKTELKDIPDKVEEYMKNKGMLNSIYGMMVTDIIRDLIEFDGMEWNTEEANMEECLNEYNNSHSRFLYYPWGVFITAYVRNIIWGAIGELGDDYIYSDTDSVKFKYMEKHKAYFDGFNEFVVGKLNEAMEHYGIEYEGNCNPKTIKGKEKIIGVFELDGVYKRFKTLGAKRYMYETDDGINITVSGVNKKTAMPWLSKTYSNPFDAFTEGLKIPPEACGKLTHTYIDEHRKGLIEDYTGLVGAYDEYSAIYMEPVGYELTVDGSYIEYIEYLKYNYKAYK